LAFYHPILLAFDVVLVGAIAVVLFPLGSGAVASSIKESKAKYAVAAWLEELAQHPMAFRGTGAQRFAATRVETLTRGVPHGAREALPHRAAAARGHPGLQGLHLRRPARPRRLAGD
jgi:putative ABC transport system ATP-binding protein